MCIKGIIQLWILILAYSATLTIVSNRDLHSDVFDLLTICIFCKQPVRTHQEGLQCDGSLRWQHRTCDTGISQSQYRDAVKTGASIDWHCLTCDIPQAESTTLKCY